MKDADERLFLVHFSEPQGGDPEPDGDDPDLFRLAPGLWLVKTSQTRSQLYHAVKRRVKPASLLVAPLSEAPKFMGMAEGALKWVRRTSAS